VCLDLFASIHAFHRPHRTASDAAVDPSIVIVIIRAWLITASSVPLSSVAHVYKPCYLAYQLHPLHP
jgi:hypothetical protein